MFDRDFCFTPFVIHVQNENLRVRAYPMLKWICYILNKLHIDHRICPATTEHCCHLLTNVRRMMLSLNLVLVQAYMEFLIVLRSAETFEKNHLSLVSLL